MPIGTRTTISASMTPKITKPVSMPLMRVRARSGAAARSCRTRQRRAARSPAPSAPARSTPASPRTADVSPTSWTASAPAAVRHAISAPKRPTSSDPTQSSAATTRGGRLCVKKSTLTSPFDQMALGEEAPTPRTPRTSAGARRRPAPATRRACGRRSRRSDIATSATNTRPPAIASCFAATSSARPTGPKPAPGATGACSGSCDIVASSPFARVA